MLTSVDLRAKARATLDFGVQYLCENGGQLNQQFHLLVRGGPDEIIVLNGDITNSADRKSEMAGMLRSRVKAGAIEAVIMLSDTWLAKNVRPHDAAQVRQLGIQAASALGLCERTQAVIATIESPMYNTMFMQEHERDRSDVVTLVGDVIEKEMAANSGRFSGLFPVASGATH